MFDQRRRALTDHQIAQGLDCVAMVPGANMRYLTGLDMFLMERPTVIFFPVEGQPACLLPTLEAGAAREKLPFEAQWFVYSDEEGYEGAFRQACAALKLAGKRIGVEYLRMRALELRRLEQNAPGSQFVALEEVVPDLRVRKDEHEIELMRHAARLTEQALAEVSERIAPGRTERELAAELKVAFLQMGAEGLSFDPLVAAGPNTTLPHAKPSTRPIAPGDLVLIDCGVTWQGYCADITRTFAIGPIDPELERVYEVVRQANVAARAAVAEGVPAQEIDRVARRVITEAGYGQHFIHRTGHGLGLEVHEPPYIVEGNERPLPLGATFTVEPGIYLPGRGGVRIEDDVAVTPDGAETLTSFPRELIRL